MVKWFVFQFQCHAAGFPIPKKIIAIGGELSLLSETRSMAHAFHPTPTPSLSLSFSLSLSLSLSRWSLEPDTTCCSSLFPLPLPLCLSLWSLEPKTKCFGWNVTSRLSLSSLRSLEPETKCFGSNVGSVPLPLLARALTSLQTPPSPSSPSHPLLTLLSLLFELEEQLAPTTSGSDMIETPFHISDISCFDPLQACLCNHL